MPRNHGRHTPAFLLLLLSDGPSYGALLLSRMQNELPYCLSDSAIVYRSLKQMEDAGLVDTDWQAEESGVPRKWYTINREGYRVLDEYAADIEQRLANLTFFRTRYQSLARRDRS